MRVVVLEQVRDVEDVAGLALELALPGDPLVEAVEEELVGFGVGPALCEREARRVEADFGAEAQDGEEGCVVAGCRGDVVGGEEGGGCRVVGA